MKVAKTARYMVLLAAAAVVLGLAWHCVGRYEFHLAEKRREWNVAQTFLCSSCGDEEVCEHWASLDPHANLWTEPLARKARDAVAKDSELHRLCQRRRTTMDLNVNNLAVLAMLDEWVPCKSASSNCGVVALVMADKMYGILFGVMLAAGVLFLLGCTGLFRSATAPSYAHLPMASGAYYGGGPGAICIPSPSLSRQQQKKIT